MPSEIGVVPFAFGRQTKFIFIVGTLLIIAGLVLIGSRSWKDLLKDVSLTPVGSVVEIPSTLILRASPETNAVAPLFGTDISAPEIDPLSVDRPTPLLIAVDTPTLQPRETTTPQPHLHAFEITMIPPGYRQGYLVHIVAVGETLDTIANRYNTTVQAIIAVNYKLKPPVWVHYPIVIPVDTKEAAGLPAFKVYVVEAYESISAESLADVLGIEANALEFYNLCTSNCQFNKEDVLLIPYAE